jgi:Rps23 Pro-64 3,4-dihydroxylase Tpa1-like proline 4-hydroxylase
LVVDCQLNGGGLHQITRGGKLDVHIDYNYHPVTKLDRRLNVLLYLNSEWDSHWKGELELWDSDVQNCPTRILPTSNRLVVFSTTEESNHGHPEPLQCPPDRTRKSIALYYYSNGRPEHETVPPHSTIFKRRPCDPVDQEQERLRELRSLKRLT